MIIGFFISIWFTLISSLLSFFPDGDLGLPQQIIDALTTIVQYLHSFSWLLPVDELLSAVITVIGFYTIILTIKSVLWLIRTIRGSGS